MTLSYTAASRGRLKLLRLARHRAEPEFECGLGGEQIWVITGVADDDTALTSMSGRGTISKTCAMAAGLRGRGQSARLGQQSDKGSITA